MKRLAIDVLTDEEVADLFNLLKEAILKRQKALNREEYPIEELLKGE